MSLVAPYLQTQELGARYRGQAVNLAERRVLITNFHGTEQEQDLSERPNCNGFGRVRHFRRRRAEQWVEDPLPIDPAAKALGLQSDQQLRAQVFQNAVCNWRCWYCFVPFTLLDANKHRSKMMAAAELVELWLQEPNRPQTIDLTGGQPELVPEWVLWMMVELRERKLEGAVYLWSDDSLSADYFWSALAAKDRELIASYPLYGRVCCFKGFDEKSFSFNTMAAPEQFARQFERMEKLLAMGLDLYGYVTFTTSDRGDLHGRMNRFVDRLQRLDENLPLRTVPLKIDIFTPTASRMNDERQLGLENQFRALEVWRTILERRFSSDLRTSRICDVALSRGARRV
jgi:uncharacterized Fe-S cluster-containing radical SAM superfamily protein